MPFYSTDIKRVSKSSDSPLLEDLKDQDPLSLPKNTNTVLMQLKDFYQIQSTIMNYESQTNLKEYSPLLPQYLEDRGTPDPPGLPEDTNRFNSSGHHQYCFYRFEWWAKRLAPTLIIQVVYLLYVTFSYTKLKYSTHKNAKFKEFHQQMSQFLTVFFKQWTNTIASY